MVKKILIAIAILLLCSCKSETIEFNDLVITYHTCNTQKNYIEIYKDKTGKKEYYMFDAFEELELNNEEYNRIIDYAFSNEFFGLNEISNVEYNSDGICINPYIALYYDNKVFITDGNSNKKIFNKLVEMLEDL